MNEKILFFIIVIFIVLSIGFYFWAQKVTIPTPSIRTIIPTPIPAPTTSSAKIKNPTISNAVNDFRGANYLEGIGMTWDRDDLAAEYILFRSASIGGPFIEIGHIPGSSGHTNAEDFTPDAQTKTLCYKLEARDNSGKTIRVYDPFCVPPWQK